MSNKVLKITSALLLAILIIPLFVSLAYADGEGGVNDLSLYNRASEVAREFGTALAPGNDETLTMIKGTGNDNELEPGSAGGLLGYSDMNSDDKGITGWFMTQYTGSSSTISYDQLKNVTPDNESGNNAFFHYAGYGEALTKMGLAKTTTGGGINSMGRMVATGLLFMFYTLASVAPFIFQIAIKILVMLNPFKLFGTVLDTTAGSDLGILSTVAEEVGGIYEAVQEFSLFFLIPALLVMTVLSVLFFAKGGLLKKFSRYAIIVFMMFAGLPLIGSTYTGVVEGLDSNMSPSSDYADYLIFSSYVDFEGWVKATRLAPPDGTSISNPRLAFGDRDDKLNVTDRKLIMNINAISAKNPTAIALRDRYGVGMGVDEVIEEGRGDSDSYIDSDSEFENTSSFKDTFKLLGRHLGSDLYTGSQYDGEVSGKIQKIRKDMGTDIDKDIVRMFAITTNDNRGWFQKFTNGGDDFDVTIDSWNGNSDGEGGAKGLFTAGPASEPEFKFGDFNYNIYNAGTLKVGLSGYYVADGLSRLGDPNARTLKPISSNANDALGGLSPLAMYNFLNTTFSDTGLVVHSSEKAVNEISRDSYTSVTFGATGVMAVTRYLENLIVIASIAFMSIIYAVNMVGASVNNIPKVLSGVFGTAFGSIKFTTKLLISTVLMILQTIGLLALYFISENIIMSFMLNSSLLTARINDYFGGAGFVVEFARSMATSIVVALIAIFMTKNAKVFRSMIEEMSTSAISRIMSNFDSKTGGQGFRPEEVKSETPGLLDGAKNLLGDANDLEGRKEALAKDKGKDPRSMKEKLGARLDTAKNLGKAKSADALKSVVGVNGKSYDREKESEEEKLKAMRYHDDSELGKQGNAEYDKDGIKKGSGGRMIDENTGEVITDEEGNAIDKDGNMISSASPLSTVGFKAVTNSDGALMNEDGSLYTDEDGNVLYEDEDGNLTNKDGDYAGIDEDGVLKPLSELKDGDNKPRSAKKSAKDLDKTRQNAKKYSKMKKKNEMTHYGLGDNGEAISENGKSHQYLGKDGLRKDAKIDDDGFITDADGNKLKKGLVGGKIDKRAFEEVKDPETGETYFKHKGDEAMKIPKGDIESDKQSLTALSKHANTLNTKADRAERDVERLKAEGASSYKIEQAERFASTARNKANGMQATFQEEMKNGGDRIETITPEHVKTASRGANMAKKKLNENQEILQELKSNGASKKEIKAQAKKVKAYRKSFNEAQSLQSDASVASATGRTIGEVTEARVEYENAESLYDSAVTEYEDAKSSGAGSSTLSKLQQRVDSSRASLNQSKTAYDSVKIDPKGDLQKRDKLGAKLQVARSGATKAKANLDNAVKNNYSPSQIKQAKMEVARTNKAVNDIEEKIIDCKKPKKAPKGYGGQVEVPNKSPQASYMELAQKGVTNYGQYQTKMDDINNSIKKDNARLKQAQNRYNDLKREGRAPQLIKQAEKQVSKIKSNIAKSSKEMENLKQNSQGLLKNGHFKPSIAKRPIRKNGALITNQLLDLGHNQELFDKLTYQKRNGTLSKSGEEQLKKVGYRINNAKTGLVKEGIREDVLRDSKSVFESVGHMTKSWDLFVSGKSIENN